jgi:hypothetical protein
VRQIDRDVADVLRWLHQGAQDRGILAQKMGVPDRRMRLAIQEARRRGELVIVTRPGPLHLYAIASSRAEYDEWRRHELMSRLGAFGEQLRAMDARASRIWPLEQLRIAFDRDPRREEVQAE